MNQHFAELQELISKFIPNLKYLDLQVQQEIEEILINMINPLCDRSHISLVARQGLLEQTPLLKAHIWKMLLGTLDIKHDKWIQGRRNNEELYIALREKFCPSLISEKLMECGCDQNYSEFDLQLWNEIALDTKRTHSTINFFQSEVEFTKVYTHKPTKNNDVLSRILYIWGRTNPSVRYVQGMNQIIAPLYYLECQHLDTADWNRQSQVFAMFSSIMSSIIDMHIKQMDECESGIMGRMITLNRYLRIADQQLWNKMQKQAIYPQCYSFRWLALWLSQQFGLYDTIRLWDHVLSYHQETRFFFVDSICIGILQLRRKTIMQTDFMTSLPIIQKLRDMDIDQVIEIGTDFFNKYKKININKEFEKSLANDFSLQGKLGKADEIHSKRGRWSYAEMLKHTTSYLSKMTRF